MPLLLGVVPRPKAHRAEPPVPVLRRMNMRAVMIALVVAVSACGGATAPGPQTLTQPSSTLPAPGSATTPAITSSPTTSLPPPVQTFPEAGVGTASSAPGTHVTPGRPRPTASATRSASPAGTTTTVTDTDTDSGKTVTLRSGQLLKVHLSNGTWDPPVSSAPGVVQSQSSTGGYPTSAPVDAVFKAVAAGPADLTAASDAACFHTSRRCMLATRLWTVHLLVR